MLLSGIEHVKLFVSHKFTLVLLRVRNQRFQMLYKPALVVRIPFVFETQSVTGSTYFGVEEWLEIGNGNGARFTEFVHSEHLNLKHAIAGYFFFSFSICLRNVYRFGR